MVESWGSLFSGFGINQIALAERKETWQAYQAQARDRIDMLKNQWRENLKAFAQKILDPYGWELLYNARYPWSTEVNLLSDIISRIAITYAKAPTRQLTTMLDDGTSHPEQAYDALLPSFSVQLNKTMASAEKYMLASGGCLILPHLKPNGKWVFRIITPDLFVPLVDPNCPDQLLGVSYITPSPDNPQSVSLYQQHIYSIEDPSNPFMECIDAHGNTIYSYRPDGSQEYPWYDQDRNPILPFALYRMDNEDTELFNRTLGLDLYDSTLKIGLMETIKSWTLINSHIQPVISGPGADNVRSQAADMAFPWTFTTGTADFQIQLLQMIDDGRRYDDATSRAYEHAAYSRGLNPSDFKATAQVSSAAALKIESEPQTTMQAQLREAARQCEAELSVVMRIIHNTLNPSNEKISLESPFRIDYAEKGTDDPLARYDLYKALEADNIISKPHRARLFNPNITSNEAAEQLIHKNAETNARLNPPQPQTQEPPNVSPPSNPTEHRQ
jgi:hypothetical protein